MASFDITSLYTNIPLQETIDIIISKLFSQGITTFICLNSQLFRSMLKISVLNTFFIFNKALYRQKHGLGMGLPLAPTFANIFMAHHEENWINNCPRILLQNSTNAM